MFLNIGIQHECLFATGWEDRTYQGQVESYFNGVTREAAHHPWWSKLGPMLFDTLSLQFWQKRLAIYHNVIKIGLFRLCEIVCSGSNIWPAISGLKNSVNKSTMICPLEQTLLLKAIALGMSLLCDFILKSFQKYIFGFMYVQHYLQYR